MNIFFLQRSKLAKKMYFCQPFENVRVKRSFFKYED